MISAINRTLFCCLLSLAMFIGADYSVKRWALDHTHYFEYQKVEFTAPVRVGEPVYMLSYNTWRRGVPTKWVDALFCYINPQTRVPTRIITNPPIFDPMYFPQKDVPRPWKFMERVPTILEGVECTSKHTITIDIGYGLTKDQVIWADTVVVQPRQRRKTNDGNTHF